MTTDKPTIRAVIREADRLRAIAHQQVMADVYAKPYYPTTAGARKLVTRIANRLEREIRDQSDILAGDIEALVTDARATAPALAIQQLRLRAANTDRKHRQDTEQSDRSLMRHQRRHRDAKKATDEARAGLSLGQRLDTALAGLTTIATGPSQSIGGDRVQGGERSTLPPWTGDPAGYSRRRATDLVTHLEGLLHDARTRDVARAS